MIEVVEAVVEALQEAVEALQEGEVLHEAVVEVLVQRAARKSSLYAR